MFKYLKYSLFIILSCASLQAANYSYSDLLTESQPEQIKASFYVVHHKTTPGSTNPAWVTSSLKISPKKQVEFIQKMIREKLPISSNALQMTKNLLFKEEIFNGWKLFGKKG